MKWFVHLFYNYEWLLKASPHVAKTVMCVWCKKEQFCTLMQFDFKKKPHCKENYFTPYVYGVYCTFDT